MYLIHNTILHSIMFLFFAAFKSLNVLLYVAIYIPALYALSNLNYRYFEKRFIDYREKFIEKFIQ
jgi:peptidoglycan/LPS O-acetylase OafA/YrhL